MIFLYIYIFSFVLLVNVLMSVVFQKKRRRKKEGRSIQGNVFEDSAGLAFENFLLRGKRK